VATYTAALLSNTAVPAWHDGYRYLSFLFAASAATSAAGAALLAGSAMTRFAVFEAGQTSAENPRHVLIPRRPRLQERIESTFRARS
jgi:hypothetical protein